MTFNYLLLVIIGYLVIVWLYALIFADENRIPETLFGKNLSFGWRFFLSILCYPFILLWKILVLVMRAFLSSMTSKHN